MISRERLPRPAAANQADLETTAGNRRDPGKAERRTAATRRAGRDADVAAADRGLVRAARLDASRPPDLLSSKRRGERRSTLLIAPTGAGKTLAGFLPSLVALGGGVRKKAGAGLFTLYVSPLKALAADVARNLTQPIDGDGPEDPDRDAYRRYIGGAPPAPARQPSTDLLTTPNRSRCFSAIPSAPISSAISTRSFSMNCMRCRRRNAAIFWRSIWRGCASSRPA